LLVLDMITLLDIWMAELSHG